MVTSPMARDREKPYREGEVVTEGAHYLCSSPRIVIGAVKKCAG